MADLVHDFRALDTARKDAEKFLASDEFWEAPEYALLKKQLEESGALGNERID
jgi:ATP-dependent DNA helicase RecG